MNAPPIKEKGKLQNLLIFGVAVVLAGILFQWFFTKIPQDMFDRHPSFIGWTFGLFGVFSWFAFLGINFMTKPNVPTKWTNGAVFPEAKKRILVIPGTWFLACILVAMMMVARVLWQTLGIP